jgi:hypothetical protein
MPLPAPSVSDIVHVLPRSVRRLPDATAMVADRSRAAAGDAQSVSGPGAV